MVVFSRLYHLGAWSLDDLLSADVCRILTSIVVATPAWLSLDKEECRDIARR
jgi:hypothetical protein